MIVLLLFSYGTLCDPAVQQANFGRLLDGRDDQLPGYRGEMLEITDATVIAISGKTHHPVLQSTGSDAARVDGVVFEITDAELVKADRYEVDDYQRVLARLASGVHAWVYVGRA